MTSKSLQRRYPRLAKEMAKTACLSRDSTRLLVVDNLAYALHNLTARSVKMIADQSLSDVSKFLRDGLCDTRMGKNGHSVSNLAEQLNERKHHSLKHRSPPRERSHNPDQVDQSSFQCDYDADRRPSRQDDRSYRSQGDHSSRGQSWPQKQKRPVAIAGEDVRSIYSIFR